MDENKGHTPQALTYSEEVFHCALCEGERLDKFTLERAGIEMVQGQAVEINDGRLCFTVCAGGVNEVIVDFPFCPLCGRKVKVL